MYLSGQSIRSLGAAYRGGVLNLTEGSTANGGCDCEHKKKKQKIKGLMFEPTEFPEKNGKTSAKQVDVNPVAEMNEYRAAMVVVEKAYDLLEAFSVEEAIEVLSTFLEMNDIEMRYSDLVGMLYELDDIGDHSDASGFSKDTINRMNQEWQRRKAERAKRYNKELQNAKTPGAKQTVLKRQKQVLQSAEARKKSAEQRERQAQAQRQQAQRQRSQSSSAPGQPQRKPGQKPQSSNALSRNNPSSRRTGKEAVGGVKGQRTQPTGVYGKKPGQSGQTRNDFRRTQRQVAQDKFNNRSPGAGSELSRNAEPGSDAQKARDRILNSKKPVQISPNVRKAASLAKKGVVGTAKAGIKAAKFVGKQSQKGARNQPNVAPVKAPQQLQGPEIRTYGMSKY